MTSLILKVRLVGGLRYARHNQLGARRAGRRCLALLHLLRQPVRDIIVLTQNVRPYLTVDPFFSRYSWAWKYNISSGTFGFDENGYGQGDLFFYPTASGYGSYSKPVTVSQTVQGLEVGRRYRLQFFAGHEFASSPTLKAGVAAIDISGYSRTYIVVPGAYAQYRTVDFIARQPSTTISFMSWGHINILGPQNGNTEGATELGLDDVILTACAVPRVPCRPTAKVSPLVLADPAQASQIKQGGKVFSYAVKIGCPESKKRHPSQVPQGQAVFTLQLPEGWTLAGGHKAMPKASMSAPSVDTNGLVTWVFPGLPSKGASIKLNIKPTTCVPEPTLVGQLCIGNGCQPVHLEKPPVMAC
jgi:hypothetical protein